MIGPRLRWLILAAAGLPAFLVTSAFVLDPQRMYNHPHGTSRLLETWSIWLGRDLTQFVPSYVFYSASSVTNRLLFSGLGLLTLLASAALAIVLIGSNERLIQPDRKRPDATLKLP
jgi:hypothetical protein